MEVAIILLRVALAFVLLALILHGTIGGLYRAWRTRETGVFVAIIAGWLVGLGWVVGLLFLYGPDRERRKIDEQRKADRKAQRKLERKQRRAA